MTRLTAHGWQSHSVMQALHETLPPTGEEGAANDTAKDMTC
jgi:hypothetical protein